MQAVQDKLTKQEMQKIKETLSLYDKDGSNMIPIGQLGTLIRVMGQCPTQSELEVVKAAIDADGNGVVELPELVELISRLRLPSGRSFQGSEAELSAAIRGVFDHDRDDYMLAAEFRHVLTTIGEKLTDEELDPIMNQFQPNGDGLVRCEDFIRCIIDGWDDSIAAGDRTA